MADKTNNNDLLHHAMADIANDIDAAFESFLPIPNDSRQNLFEAMRYSAIGGGKRLRPLLLVATASLYNVERKLALPVAAAIEAIHVYSLIHDDLPCMDDDDMRRGKPTLHIAYGEASAILAGDSLHALAFEILANPATHSEPSIRAELTLCLARAAGSDGMAGGQVMDLAAENSQFDLQEITQLQALKTGALISASVEMGAILARAPLEERALLAGYARDIGLAFQIADDILDVEGDPKLAGKALNKDAAAGKGTFVSILGMERAKEQAAQLLNQAIEQLSSFGSEAALLRSLAHYILARDR